MAQFFPLGCFTCTVNDVYGEDYHFDCLRNGKLIKEASIENTQSLRGFLCKNITNKPEIPN